MMLIMHKSTIYISSEKQKQKIWQGTLKFVKIG